MRLKREWPLEQEAGAESTAGASAETTPTPAANAEAAPAADLAVGGEGDSDTVDADGPSKADVELFSDVADGETETATKPAVVAAPAATPVKPATVPVAATPATPAAAAPATPEVKPAVTPAVTPAAEPAKPAAAAAETSEAKTVREAAEKADEEKLFNGLVDYYKIPDDMAARLPTEPENVLPVLAAKLHQALARSMTQMISQHLPQQIAQVQHLQRVDMEAKNSFYAANPDLKQYEEQVLQAGTMYRKLNPTAAPDVAIRAIGKIVRDSLGLTVATPGGGTVPAAATAALAPAFSPAGSAGARSAAAPSSENEFERMASELD